MKLLPLLPLLLLTGCPKQGTVNQEITPLGSSSLASAVSSIETAQSSAVAAGSAAQSAYTARLGKIAADSDAAHKAVKDGRTADADGALTVQQGHLTGVERDAEERAKLAEAEKLRAEGKVDAANQSITELTQQAKDDAGRIAVLQAERDKAFETLATVTAESKAAVDAALKELEDNRIKNQELVSGLQAKITEMQDKQKERDRRLWVNGIRGAGLLLIVLGIGMAALTKGLKIIEGASLVAGGILIIIAGAWIDWLLAQAWFPWVTGLVVLGILTAVISYGVRLYKHNQLNAKVIAAVNDAKTEAASLGETGAEFLKQLEPHIEYRLGQIGSASRKQFDKLQVALGLDSDHK